MKYLFILACLVLFAQTALLPDLVDMLIPGYVKHKWYSGTFSIIQVILTSPLALTITCSSTRNATPITIRSFCGSMEGPDALVCSAWSIKTDPLFLKRALPTLKSTLTLGTLKLICYISNPLEELDSVHQKEVRNMMTEQLHKTTIRL